MTKYEWESELKKNIHRLPAEEIRKVLEYYDEIFADKIERGLGESEIVSQFGNPVDVADKILSEYDGEFRDETPVPTPDVRRDEISGEKPKESVKSAEPAKSEPIKSERTQSVKSNGENAQNGEKLVPPAHGGVATAPAPMPNEPLVPPYKPARSALKPLTQKSDEGLKGDRLALFLVLNVITGFVFFILLGVAWIVAASLVAAGGVMALGGIAGTVISVFHALAGAGASGMAATGMCVALCGVGILFVVGCVMLIKLMAKGTTFLFSSISAWLCPKNTVIVGGGEKA